MKQISLWFLAFWLAITSFAQNATPPSIYGRVQGEYYHSPTGLFKVKIPVLPELGGVINDTRSAVVFRDSFTENLSIGAFPLSRTQRWELETRALPSYLEFFFINFVFRDFAANVPGAQIESFEHLPEVQGGAMIAYTLLPDGSLYDNQNRLGLTLEQQPAVAKRANLLFIHNGYAMVLSSEIAERVLEKSTYSKSPQEENEVLKQRLIGAIDRIVFLDDQPAGS